MPFFPEGYASKQTLKTKDGQNRDLVFQSGYALFTFKGIPKGPNKDEIWILTDAVWQGTPTVQAVASLAFIANLGTAVNACWAAESLSAALYNGRILLQVPLMVDDSDGYIKGLAYQVTAVGTLQGRG